MKTYNSNVCDVRCNYLSFLRGTGTNLFTSVSIKTTLVDGSSWARAINIPNWPRIVGRKILRALRAAISERKRERSMSRCRVGMMEYFRWKISRKFQALEIFCGKARHFWNEEFLWGSNVAKMLKNSQL